MLQARKDDREFSAQRLKRYFEEVDRSKLPADMVSRISVLLSTLHAAQDLEGMSVPNFRLHPLKGNLKGFWSVTVRGNWRIIFRFEQGNAFDVDLVDYH